MFMEDASDLMARILSGPLLQHERLLTLTLGGTDFVPHRLVGEERVSRPFAYTLDCISQRGDLELKRLIAQPAELAIRQADGHYRQLSGLVAIAPGSQVVSDGLRCFRAFDIPAYTHERVITGSGCASAQIPAFNWVNTMLGNVKNAITGSYHAIRGQHVPRYLAEFEYRFNRCYDLKAMIPRLLAVAVKTPPMPYRLLKLAELYT